MKRNLIPALLTLLLTMGLSSAAHADTVFFALVTPNVTANPGATVDFYAFISEQQGTYFFLDGDSYSVEAPLSLDDSGQFMNFDQLFFDHQQDFGLLFSVTLPINIPTGTYLGSYTLLGGFQGTDTDELSSQNFQITTVNAVAPVPEPSTLLLLCCGLMAVACGYKRRRRQARLL
jgi:hypothetical protein